MTMKMRASSDWQWGDRLVYRPAPGQAAVPPRRAAHANDEAAVMVLSPPRDVAISVMRTAFTGPRSMMLEERADSFVLLLPVDGEPTVPVDGKPVNLTSQRAIVFARGEGPVEWQGNARALILRLPRRAIQINASARHGGARRLAQRPLTLDLSRATVLRHALAELVRHDADERQGGTIVADIMATLVTQHGADAAFPLSRSISLARACLDRCATEPLALEELAGRAGVTTITLQRGFKACFGMTVAAYSQAVRLYGAQARLRCGWESRSIADIAHGAGFQSVTAFARAYLKLFGETPTQTRMTASRMNNIEHIDST